MDIKQTVTQAVEKICEMLKKDESLLERFQKEPIKVIEEITGKDLPDEKIESVVELVKAKLNSEKYSDAVNNVKDMLGGLKKLF